MFILFSINITLALKTINHSNNSRLLYCIQHISLWISYLKESTEVFIPQQWKHNVYSFKNG